MSTADTITAYFQPWSRTEQEYPFLLGASSLCLKLGIFDTPARTQLLSVKR